MNEGGQEGEGYHRETHDYGDIICVHWRRERNLGDESSNIHRYASDITGPLEGNVRIAQEAH